MAKRSEAQKMAARALASQQWLELLNSAKKLAGTIYDDELQRALRKTKGGQELYNRIMCEQQELLSRVRMIESE